ncbi:hypothetical protein PoB_001220500 [Plakobranchus ocellatus]|uniref:Uncharacterized protein n=1 Tax=Plakobranchus ocellatus TaxID=259542 RepID=A0AAV3YRD7_9GAST|nr:hypothetical protein PoB_001220500 [Plakobranchus ocellatus]
MLPILEDSHWTTIHTRFNCCRMPVNVTAFLTSALVFPRQRVGISESGTVRLFGTLPDISNLGGPREDSERALLVPTESELSRETNKVRIWARAIYLIGRRLTEEAFSFQYKKEEKIRASPRTKTKKEVS